MKRLIILQSVEPEFNLAAEEYVFLHAEDDTVILWQNKNAVIIGRNQNTLSEINRESIEKYGISVVRRITGGGAVFHDLGNINYSIISLNSGPNALNFRKFAEPITCILSSMGVNAEFSGRNDLTVNGRKISGNAQHISGERILHHGTLLFSSDLDKVSEVLTVDPRKIRTKAVSSVRSRVANISEFLPDDSGMTALDFISVLETYFIEKMSCKLLPLTEEENRNINTLAASKYRTWQWNYGNSPKYSFSKTEYLPCGTVEISLEICDGRIINAAVYGDFFSIRPKEEFIALLLGKEHSETALMTLFKSISINDYFVGTDADELIRCFF